RGNGWAGGEGRAEPDYAALGHRSIENQGFLVTGRAGRAGRAALPPRGRGADDLHQCRTTRSAAGPASLTSQLRKPGWPARSAAAVGSFLSRWTPVPPVQALTHI